MKHNFSERITEKFKGIESFTTREAAIALETSSYVIRGTLENMASNGRVILVSKGKCGRAGIPATWKIPTHPNESISPTAADGNGGAERNDGKI